MKPNYALKLSHDGVEILQRGASSWELTGSTRFDVPDLDGTMKRLRDAAEKRAPEGLRSKLIMPDSEVRFATVLAPGPTDEARRLQIEAEIEGLTPYALPDLAYDFVIEGDYALVALCAREILGEAEQFAQMHGFNPVSFAAIAPAGAFIGEPFFGETSCARAFLPAGTRVERESRATRAAAPPKPDASSRPASPVSVPSATPAIPGARAAASVAAAAPEAFSRVGNLVRRMGTRVRREQIEAETPRDKTPQPVASARSTEAPAPTSGRAPVPQQTEKQTPKPAQADAGKPDTGKPETGKPETGAGKATTVTAASSAPPEVQKPPESQKPEPSATPAGSEAGAKQGAAESGPKPASGSFASRRSATAAATPGKSPTLVADGPGARVGTANPGGRIAVLPAASGKTAPSRATRLYRRSRRAAKGVLASVGLFRPGVKKADKQRPVQPPVRQKTEPETGLKPVVAGSRPPTDERAKATEAQALTIFGARNMQSAETGFARRGLMLTGGLIILLVAVAIWAIYFTTTPGRDAEVATLPQQEVTPLPQIEPPARLAAPATESEDTTPEPAPESATAPAEEAVESDVAAAAPSTDPEALLEALVQEALTEAMPTDRLGQAEQSVIEPGATEDGPAESPTDPAPTLAQPDAEAPTDPGSETVFDSAESPQIIQEADSEPAQRLALPPMLERPELAEVAPVAPSPPPPFGVEFALGADGLVEATPEGALTPAGVTVFAGPPSEVPPARPAGLAPEPPAPVAPEPEPEAALPEQTEVAAPEEVVPEEVASEQEAVIADDTPRADPALAGFRPQPRSPRVAELADQLGETETEPAADPAAEPASEVTETDDDNAALAPPPGGVLLDGLRPQRRPTDLVPPAETATAEAADDDLVIDEDTAPEAVAVSLRPSVRPDDMSARAQAALAAAAARTQQAAAPQPAAQQPAAQAPAATATAAPNIPTSASVAEQATQARAINLRRVNLIGVFGTPNDRRALVRLSNGQVVRVQVGDNLDGGRVSAIGDDELRYVKNGRNEILRIGTSG
ncbi:MAG: hypothetical protein JJU15_01670 [Pararhodobacter sp.]|nr:hypothetical protein [Pararhodobacter sp.]